MFYLKRLYGVPCAVQKQDLENRLVVAKVEGGGSEMDREFGGGRCNEASSFSLESSFLEKAWASDLD